MNLGRSDLWFGAILTVFFALAGYVFFGRAVTDSSFWRMVVPFVGSFLLISWMRGPLAKLEWAPRAVAWFGIGFMVAILIAIGGNHEVSLIAAAGFGLAIAIFEFILENYVPAKDAGSS